MGQITLPDCSVNNRVEDCQYSTSELNIIVLLVNNYSFNLISVLGLWQIYHYW